MTKTDSRRGLIAVTCVIMLLLSMIAGSYPVGAAVIAGGNVAGNAGPAPSVEIADATINDSTTSDIEVAYNATGQIALSNLKITVSGPNGFDASVTNSSTHNFASKLTSTEGTVKLRIPPDTYEGGNFTLDAEVKKEGPWNPVASDSGLLNISTPVTVESVSVTPSTQYEGKNITVSTELENPTESSENFTVSTTKTSFGNTREVKGETVTVRAGSTLNVTHNVSFSYTGTHSIRVNRQPSKSVTVERSPITTEAVSVNESSVSSGDVVRVNVSANNTLQSSYTETITLEQNSTTVATKDVTFSAGEQKNVTFTKTMTNAGGHALKSGFESALVVVTSSDVKIDGFQLNETSIYTDEPIAVNVTVNNTASSSRQYSVAATSEGSPVGQVEQVDLDGSSTEYVEIPIRGHNFYQAGEYNISANSQPSTPLTVEKAVVFKGMQISDETPSKDQTVTVNLTYTNRAGSQQTKYSYLWAGSSHQKQLTISGDQTVNATYQVSFSKTGPHYLWAEGTSKDVFVMNDTTGTPNLTVSNVYEPPVAVNNSSTFIPVEVTNNGNASGIKNVTLSVDGTVVDSRKAYVDTGDSRTVGLMHTFTSKGKHSASVNTSSSTHPFTINVTGPVVVDGSVSVEHESGTAPSQNPQVSARYGGGYLGFQIKNQNGRYDLSKIGADNTTEFRINLTVQNFTPRILVSSGQNLEWTRSPGPTANQTNLSVVVHPSRLDFKTQFEGGYPSSPTEWDASVKNDTADFGWDTAILMGIGEATGDFVDAEPSDLDGMTVSTDAQLFSMPTYVPASNGNPARLKIPLAAPHETVNGNVNEGYYEAFIPGTLLSEWGVTDPESELAASYTGAPNTNLNVTEVSDGAIVTLSLHYSSGTVSITRASSGGSNTGSESSPSQSGVADPTADSTTEEPTDESIEPAVTVSNIETTNNGSQAASASVANAKANSTVSLTFEDTDASENETGNDTADTALEQLNVSLSDDADFDVNVSTSVDAPAEAAPSGTPDSSNVVSYVQIDHSGLSDDQISAASLTVRVEKSYFGDDFDPSNAAVYRLHDGTWTELETVLVGETATHYRLRADSPGLSVFAVGQKSPDLSATASLSSTMVRIGQDVTVDVTVTNDGTGQGTYTSELTVDGSAAQTKTITVPAGESVTASLSWEFVNDGDYALAVNGDSVGTVTVENLDRQQNTTTTAAEAPATTTTTDETPGFGIFAALLAFAAMGLLAGRYR